ncbi:hypothetical protein CV016_20005 [Yersinia kristensenii]|uniref:Fimbrial protein n=2 Tax=Yersinia kristensenii TaxID=28152 RepID=A0AB73NML6_YERKR|nr:hypothetical protein [Yersinia kristensenii]OVZ80120.1 hypothetical protein CBW52_12485 [Yersinia kristensenii]PJG60998.1 hypothetical protein CV016_20005 [Yersinia kristensenii]
MALALTAGAATSNSAIIDVTLINNQHTCSLGFNGTNATSLNYDLGVISNGRKTHAPFTVDITCQGDTPVKTALTARNQNGNLVAGNDKMVLPIGGNVGSSGPLLGLENNGKNVMLTGNEVDAFCVQTGINSSCSLSPVTEVSASDPRGEISATIRFDVVYPA